MTTAFEYESWLIETGDIVISKEVQSSAASLTPHERLIYCVWVADYGMRNAGDLETARELYPFFQSEACTLARKLSLQYTLDTFSLSENELCSQYFDRFEGVCNELKNA
ncbi:gag-polypeptide of LTR copia-type domain-containing protein [Undibacterium crateris]|uniref:hypothetical protein n=1 Tax=Undibacterium crateris TaxID=2528175 RepID=UPI00138A3A84|nr:hypothetical protein [Undibacterium crateris]NDI84370.1 hypothetical protein [Undibacterium crateris]